MIDNAWFFENDFAVFGIWHLYHAWHFESKIVRQSRGGIEKNKKYQIESIQESREEGEIAYKEEKHLYEGSALMNGGINLPVGCKDYEGFCFVLNAVSDPKLLK